MGYNLKHKGTKIDELLDKAGTALQPSDYTAEDVLDKIKTKDGEGSGLDADTLDGVHYQNILERKCSGGLYQRGIGWKRIAETINGDSIGCAFRLYLYTSYNDASNEAYIFDITIAYNGTICITQHAGTAKRDDLRVIPKIRIDYRPSKIAYIDVYHNHTGGNGIYWTTEGAATSYKTIQEATLLGTAYEFVTAGGDKTDRGYVGNLNGTATKALQDGDGNVIPSTYAKKSDLSAYVTEIELTNKGYATTSAMNTALDEKVDAVSGKQLSTEDFTTALKNKLTGLSNYDDTAVNNAINGLQTQINTLVSGDANTAIESFNEIIAFLDGVTDTQTLEGIIAGIEQQIAGKQDTITDLATIRSGAAKGATALQSHQDISGKLDKTEAASTYVPRSGGSLNDGASLTFSLYGTRTLKVTGNSIEVDMSKDTGGWAGTFASIKDPLNDVTTILGWYGGTGGLTHIFMGGSYNDPAMKMEKNGQFTFRYSPKVGNKTIATVEDLAKVATSGSYNDLSDKPTIPSAVTESTVSGWGFTKNTGTYSKPSTGIPKSDLASAVQTSLEKADSALQSYTESDPVFKASAAAGITSSDITNWNSKTSNTGTITGIKMNGASKGTSGVVDLGTVITSHQDISGKLNNDGVILNIKKVTSLPSSPDANTLYVIVEA